MQILKKTLDNSTDLKSVINQSNNIFQYIYSLLGSVSLLPIGTILRYNNLNNDWIDDTTIKGFYACVVGNTNIQYTNINGAVVNIPNNTTYDGPNIISIIKIK